MRYAVHIIIGIKGTMKELAIEMPDNISSVQTLYMCLKERCDLPKLGKGEICICSKDKNRDITLFVVSEAETILYSPCKDMSMIASLNTLYLTYCNPAARAKEIFLANNGSHYHMWHEGYEEEYAMYGIDKEQEMEWLQKHGLSPQIP